MRQTYRTLTVLGLVVSVLAGCAFEDSAVVSDTEKSEKPAPQEPVVMRAPLPPQRILPVPRPRPKLKPIPKPTATATPAPTATPTATPKKSEAVGFAVDPRTLVKLDELAILDKMGQPTQIRDEPPAVVWDYETGDCRLHIFFYESVNTKKLVSLNYKLESTAPGVSAEKHCIRN